MDAFFRDASLKGITSPDGSVKRYAPGTIEKWYRAYKSGGFDALVPAGRSDAGKPRKLDDDLQEQIRYLKVNYPRMSAAAIYRQLQDNSSIRQGKLSESTINRYINQLALELKTTNNQDMPVMNGPTSMKSGAATVPSVLISKHLTEKSISSTLSHSLKTPVVLSPALTSFIMITSLI